MTRSTPDTHALTRVNNVIAVLNYVIAAHPSLLKFMIADTLTGVRARRSSTGVPGWPGDGDRASAGTRCRNRSGSFHWQRALSCDAGQRRAVIACRS